jgi:threonyl-tRNA synthetase
MRWVSKIGLFTRILGPTNLLTSDLSSVVAAGDYTALESLANIAVKEKQPFERLIVSKEDLLKMFEVSAPRNRTVVSFI